MFTIRKIAQSSIAASPFVLLDNGTAIAEASRFLDCLCLRGVSKNTLRAYAFDLLAFYRFLDISHIALDQISHCHAISFIKTQRESKLAPRTINRKRLGNRI